jgi:hypothetical protein
VGTSMPMFNFDTRATRDFLIERYIHVVTW